MAMNTQTQITDQYVKTNAWLQQAAIDAGAGKSVWPPKPSVSDARDIVDSFLQYRSITIGTLELFKGNCIQFEQTGEIFHSENALTQSILEDSASRGLVIDPHMVAFVSTSAHAVSSDAVFLHLMLHDLEKVSLDNPFIPDTVTSVHAKKTSGREASVTAKAGFGVNIWSVLRAGFSGSATQHTGKSTAEDVVTTGNLRIDSKYRETLTGISTIYSLEKSGVIPAGRFMHTLTSLSAITARKTDDLAIDKDIAGSLLAEPTLSVNCINDAWLLDKYIQDFLWVFCKDNLKSSRQKTPPDNDEIKFWAATSHAVEMRSVNAIPLMQRYIDHHDQPEASMVFSLLNVWHTLDTMAQDATNFLMSGEATRYDKNTPGLRGGHKLRALYLSPVFQTDKALAVIEDPFRHTLRSELISIQNAVDMFPSLERYTYGNSPYLYTSKDADWEYLIGEVRNINVQLNADHTDDSANVIHEQHGSSAVYLDKEKVNPKPMKASWC